jgi:hypothetical protein
MQDHQLALDSLGIALRDNSFGNDAHSHDQSDSHDPYCGHCHEAIDDDSPFDAAGG